MEVLQASPALAHSELDPNDAADIARKRARSEPHVAAFGDDIEDDDTSVSKIPKLQEGDTPTRSEMTEKSEAAPKETASSTRNPLNDIFDSGDVEDYEHATDRANRLSYLTSTGAKPKKTVRYDEKATFQDSAPQHRPAYHDIDYTAKYKAPTQRAPVKSSGIRSKLEHQEFVKDSVQNKLTRESAISLKPSTTKTLDFGAFFQNVSDRQQRIKLATAEQVGLDDLVASHANGEDDADAESDDGMELSIEEAGDELSIEIDEETEQKDAKTENFTKPAPVSAASTSMPPPAPLSLARSVQRSKTVVNEDQDGAEASQISIVAPPRATPTVAPVFSLDDYYLDDDDETDAKNKADQPPKPSMTQSQDSGPSLRRADSLISPPDSSLRLELESTLEPVADAPKVTPGGVKMKASESTSSKSSLMSSWLSGQKSQSKPTTKTNPPAPKAATKPKKNETMEFFDENAMTGDTEEPQKRRLKKVRQLFDDEAEQGFGSDASQGEGEEALSVSEDESEGGASQDAYEDEQVNDENGKPVDDIFESSDQLVIRSVIMEQERRREEAEAAAASELVLRSDRHQARLNRMLQEEAEMLKEERRMEARMEARRERRRQQQGEVEQDEPENDDSPVGLGDTSSSMALPAAKEWYMDDDDEEAEKEPATTKSRRELLAEQQNRRKITSSSQYLLQDESSQSILQLIEKAHTQHSQASLGSSSANNEWGMYGDEQASQDAFSLGGFYEHNNTSTMFSAGSMEHLSKLKATFKGTSTQLVTSALLFQRSQDGHHSTEHSQDAPSPSIRNSTGSSSSRSTPGLSRAKYNTTRK